MLRRQLGEAFTQHIAAILHLQDLVWSVGNVPTRLGLAFVELQLIKTWANRESLVTRDRKDPSQDRRAAFESAGLAPYLKEHVAGHVLGQCVVPQPT